MAYNIISVVDSWSVRCANNESDASTSFIVDEKGLSFLTSDGLNGILISGDGTVNQLKGDWEFEVSPIIPDAPDKRYPTTLGQVVDLIGEAESRVTLQSAYDNFSDDLDGALNGFSGDTPIEFRVANASLNLGRGNVTIALRDRINDRVEAGIDLTGDVLSFCGSVRVPNTIASSDPSCAVNVSRLMYEIDSLLKSTNTWTKNNVFAGGLQSSKEPVFDADVVNKKYLDSSLSSRIHAATEAIKNDLDSFEGQNHLWFGKNDFSSTTNFTGDVQIKDPTTDNNPTTKKYVDDIEARIGSDIEEFKKDSSDENKALSDRIDFLKGDVDTFEDQNHTWAEENVFNAGVTVLDPTTDNNPTTKKYVDTLVATNNPWQGGLDVTGDTTVLSKIKGDVYKSYQWRITNGTITVGGVKYANGDLIIANKDMVGDAQKLVENFSFFNGQDADVVKTAEAQDVSNKRIISSTVLSSDLSSSNNTYRAASNNLIGAVKIANDITEGDTAVPTSDLVASKKYGETGKSNNWKGTQSLENLTLGRKSDGNVDVGFVDGSGTVVNMTIPVEEGGVFATEASLAAERERAIAEVSEVRESFTPLMDTVPPEGDNNADVYGFLGTLRSLGAFGGSVLVRKLSVFNKSSGTVENQGINLWARILKNVNGSWVIAAQSEEPRKWGDFALGAEIPFVMKAVDGVTPPSADEKVAIVFVNNASAASSVSNGILSFEVVDSIPGGFNTPLGSDANTASPNLSYSPRIKLRFAALSSVKECATREALDSLAETVSNKANDADVVKLTGDQTISGIKRFEDAIYTKVIHVKGVAFTYNVDPDTGGAVFAFEGANPEADYVFPYVAEKATVATIEDMDKLERISVLPLGSKTALGADAYGLHVSATGGLQLFGTHFLNGDIWTDDSLKMVKGNVSLYSTDKASIGFDYANEVTFRTMPNDGNEATYKLEAWQWNDEHTEKSPSAGVKLLKPSQKTPLEPTSVLNTEEGDARWVRGLATEKNICIGERASSEATGFGVAIGNEATVSSASSYAIALGFGTSTNTGFSASIGVHARSYGHYSISFGFDSVSNGESSISIGAAAKTENFFDGIAIGSGSISSGTGSIALGSFTETGGEGAVTLGKNARAFGTYSVSLGAYSSSGQNTRVADHAIAIGSESKSLGWYSSIAIGHAAYADKDYAIAIGKDAESSGFYAISLGTDISATSDFPIVIGSPYTKTIKVSSSGIMSISDKQIAFKDDIPTKFTATNPALTSQEDFDVCTWEVNHAKGSEDILVCVYEVSTKSLVYPDVVIVDKNKVNLIFSSGDIDAGTYKVVIY